jgi:hypothetical protein
MINQPVSPYPEVLAFLTANFSANDSHYLFQIVKEGEYPYSLRLLGSGFILSRHLAHNIILDIKAAKTPQLEKFVENMPPDWTPFQGGSHFTTLKITHDGTEYSALISPSAMNPDNLIVHAEVGPNSTIELTFVRMHANWWFVVIFVIAVLLAIAVVGAGAVIDSLKQCTPVSGSVTAEGPTGPGGMGGGMIELTVTAHSPKVIIEEMPGTPPPGGEH